MHKAALLPTVYLLSDAMAGALRINWSVALPDAPLGMIFEHVLSVNVIAVFSAVCRRWRAATRDPSSWVGKTVFIEGFRGISRESMCAWIGRWGSVDRVHLTYSQLDMLDTPLALPHAIVHLWQTERVRTRRFSWRERDLDLWEGSVDVSTSPLGFWNEVTIGGEPWLACLTDDRVPDEVRLMREALDDDGVDLWDTIFIGWTNAWNFDDLADMCAFGHDWHAVRETDRIVYAQMYSDIEWEKSQRYMSERGMQDGPRAPPLYKVWDQNGARSTVCTAQLHRAVQHITMTTSDGREYRYQMHGAVRPIEEDMRFFVAMPDNRELRQVLVDCPHRDFVSLPVPFLVSTLLPGPVA